MAAADWIDDDNVALFTDFYQLTMLQAYVREGMNEDAVFDLFIRRLGHRNYLVACGLETVLSFLENLHFSDAAIDYISSQGAFDAAFIEYLARFRFSGDVYAVEEGTPVFADEPIIEVVAPLGEAQIVETFLLNQITFQTNAATKASRVRYAAGDRLVVDFGMRRMHAADATLKGARAYHIAGLDGTSNVLAGKIYGLPVSGTMAHSYIEAHDLEEDAFEAFSDLFPETILLVDTYDTLEGVHKVIQLAQKKGDAFKVRGVRLDSGDLGELAKSARRMLNDAGLNDVMIFASGSLDEYSIKELLDGGAPIDGFGVGTHMGTIADQPYLDSAYKLSGYANKPRMKLSSQKANLPGRKQIFRSYDKGIAVGDVIAEIEEDCPGTPLLRQVMRDGRRIEESERSLEDIRRHVHRGMATLPPELRRLEKQNTLYPVQLSHRLRDRLHETRRRLENLQMS